MILFFWPTEKAISVPRKWRRVKASANVYWSVLSFDFITAMQRVEQGLPDHETSYSAELASKLVNSIMGIERKLILSVARQKGKDKDRCFNCMIFLYLKSYFLSDASHQRQAGSRKKLSKDPAAIDALFALGVGTAR